MSASKFTPEIAAEILEWIADGKTLRAYCRQEGRPSFHAVYRWVTADEEFREKMEIARQVGFDAIADEALAIADTPQRGTIETVEGAETTQGSDGKTDTKPGVRTIRTEDMLGHRKLQVETRLKLLAKWHPKKYGERTTLAGDPEAPLGVVPVIQITAYPDEKGGDAKD